jgi:hypothetical protein
VRHREHQVIVPGVLTVRVRELAELTWRRGCGELPSTSIVTTPCRLGAMGSLRQPGARGAGDTEPARHAKVYCEHFALVEMDEQVLGASVEPHHHSSCQALSKALRQGKAQVAAALIDADEPMATEYGFQTSAHRLDLGEFRHWPNQAPGSTINPAASMPATVAAASSSEAPLKISTAPSSSPAFPVAISAVRGDLDSEDFEGGVCLKDGERQRFEVHLAGASERGREGFLGSLSSMGI